MNEQLKSGIRNTQENVAALPGYLLEERGETVSSDEQNTLNDTCAYLDDAVVYFTSLDDLDKDEREKREVKGFKILELINGQIDLRKREKEEEGREKKRWWWKRRKRKIEEERWKRRLSGIYGARLHAYPFRRIALGLQDDILWRRDPPI